MRLDDIPTNELTNFNIINYVDRLRIPHFSGCYMIDELPRGRKIRRNECAIVNFNKSKERGSHWVAIYRKGRDKIYFDSFGYDLPPQISNFMKTRKEIADNEPSIKRNSVKVQADNTSECGKLCLHVLYKLTKTKDTYNQILYNLKKRYDKARDNERRGRRKRKYDNVDE